ncbi:hypothetical protein AB0M46_37605 [Dactylosporangium sp. NPDC051485]|uniref:hypothetical protein n=1 Tax=Dactylosporangium sp. NPDC051485 TaxID=3154846 RepID=UPI0034368DD5
MSPEEEIQFSAGIIVNLAASGRIADSRGVIYAMLSKSIAVVAFVPYWNVDMDLRQNLVSQHLVRRGTNLNRIYASRS